VVKFLGSFLSSHCFWPCPVFFNVDEFLRPVHSRVPGAFAFGVEFKSGVQVFRVARVEAVSFAQDNVDVVGHCKVRSVSQESFLFWSWIYACWRSMLAEKPWGKGSTVPRRFMRGLKASFSCSASGLLHKNLNNFLA